MKMLVNSCIRGLDSIGMSMSRKSCAAGPLEGGRHAVRGTQKSLVAGLFANDKSYWQRMRGCCRG